MDSYLSIRFGVNLPDGLCEKTRLTDRQRWMTDATATALG